MTNNILLWSTKKPTVPGYYFYRRGKHVDVCKVYQIAVENPQYAFKKDTEWAGPIPEPRDKS